MTAWWNGLNVLQQILYCIAVPATIVMLIQTVLMLIGLGGHGDFSAGHGPIDGGVGHDIPHDAIVGGHSTIGHGGLISGMHDTPTAAGHDAQGHAANAVDQEDVVEFHLFSMRSILAFFVVFGWVGIAMAENKSLPAIVVVLVAFASGLAVLFLTAWMFYALLKLQNSGNVKLANAVGLVGEVYIPIPANRNGQGKINLLLQGRWFECDAITTGTEPLKTKQAVKVVDIMGDSVLVVEPVQNK